VNAMETLLLVQDRDTRILRLEREKRELPQRLGRIDEEVAAEVRHLEQNKEDYRHTESERKRLELEMQAAEEKIRRWQAQLFQIKTNEEYQALTHEIQEARTAASAIEDRLLDLMERLDQMKAEAGRTEAAIAEARARGESRKTELTERGARIAAELAKLAEERAGHARDVPADVLRLYERILQSKGDTALVAVVKGICQGCHLRVTPQMAMDALREDRTARCDNCGRLLYAADA